MTELERAARGPRARRSTGRRRRRSRCRPRRRAAPAPRLVARSSRLVVALAVAVAFAVPSARSAILRFLGLGGRDDRARRDAAGRAGAAARGRRSGAPVTAAEARAASRRPVRLPAAARAAAALRAATASSRRCSRRPAGAAQRVPRRRRRGDPEEARRRLDRASSGCRSRPARRASGSRARSTSSTGPPPRRGWRATCCSGSAAGSPTGSRAAALDAGARARAGAADRPLSGNPQPPGGVVRSNSSTGRSAPMTRLAPLVLASRRCSRSRRPRRPVGPSLGTSNGWAASTSPAARSATSRGCTARTTALAAVDTDGHVVRSDRLAGRLGRPARDDQRRAPAASARTAACSSSATTSHPDGQLRAALGVRGRRHAHARAPAHDPPARRLLVRRALARRPRSI